MKRRFRDFEQNYQLIKDCPEFQIRSKTIPMLGLLNFLTYLFRFIFLLWLTENIVEIFFFKKPFFLLLNKIKISFFSIPFSILFFSGLFSMIIFTYIYIMRNIKKRITELEFQNFLKTRLLQKRDQQFLIFRKDGPIAVASSNFYKRKNKIVSNTIFDLAKKTFNLDLQEMLDNKKFQAITQTEKNKWQIKLIPFDSPKNYLCLTANIINN
ncbi:hypothetical protein HN511_01910 [bacterium]|jgi:hypothetical protein|nr:hypothetical protein [bacterium]